MARKLLREASNPLTEISELQVYAEAFGEADDLLTIFSDVRIAPTTGEVNGRDFKYGPRRAVLSFRISGCEPVKGARFSDTLPESMEVLEVQSQVSTTQHSAIVEASAGIAGRPDGRELSGGGSVSGEAKTSSVTRIERTSSAKKIGKFVKSRPNLQWDIEPRNDDDPNSFLCESYLAGHEMFSAKVFDRTNQVSISGVLYCRKKDFGIVAVDKKFGSGFFGAPNREAIMSLILQKALKDADTSCGMLGEEFLVLSKCIVGDLD